MTEHLNNLINALTGKIGTGIGFLSGIFTFTSANNDIPIDVMHWVAFSISNVQFPVQSILTLVGGMTTFTFFVAQMYALARERASENRMAENLEARIEALEEESDG